MLFSSFLPYTFIKAKDDCSMSQSLFINTIYGTGIGMVLGSLAMVSLQRTNDWTYFAKGGLYGAGVGAGVGLVEFFFFSGCLQGSSATPSRFGNRLKIYPQVASLDFHPKSGLQAPLTLSGLSLFFSFEF
jgi:hypothetical protein